MRSDEVDVRDGVGLGRCLRKAEAIVMTLDERSKCDWMGEVSRVRMITDPFDRRFDRLA